MENYPVSGQIDSRLKVELKVNLLSAKYRLSYYKALPALTSFAASFLTFSDTFIKPLHVTWL